MGSQVSGYHAKCIKMDIYPSGSYAAGMEIVCDSMFAISILWQHWNIVSVHKRKGMAKAYRNQSLISDSSHLESSSNAHPLHLAARFAPEVDIPTRVSSSSIHQE
jgi:hypothetical protein